MKFVKTTMGIMSTSLVLVACGGSDSSDPTPTATPTPTPTVTTTPTGCGADQPSFVSCTDGVYTLSGNVDQDYTMAADLDWRLDGVVTVGAGNVTVESDADVAAIQDAGVTLTIEAGADIKAFDDGVLLVTRGSKLMAEGNAAEPITFSSVDDGYDGEGEWGGIIIQGFAPQYGQGGTGPCYSTGTVCNVSGEGGTEVAVYGGNIEDDNSGIIKYVRIAEGGLVAGPNNEINGLTLQGVGHGTEVDYIHVHGNLDDGVEWFGGTVNVKHLVLTNNDDDDIDFDEGYKGNIQYALVIKNQIKEAPTGENDPRGIEANSSDKEFVPETEAVIANVTIVGGPVNNYADDKQPGMRLRGSVTVDVHNSAVKGFDTGCIRIDDSNTDASTDGSIDDTSTVTLNNVIGDCADGFYDKRDADTATNAGAANIDFDAAYAILGGEANLGASATINAVNNGSGFMFDQTDFIGAVKPGTLVENTWWYGWTLPVLADLTSQPEEATFADCDETTKVCTVSGTIDKDYTFVSSYEWRLDDVVVVGAGNVTITTPAQVTAIQEAGVTLTIEPGTNIKAFDDGVLLVTRGSKIMAEGTAVAPITFSSIDADIDGEGEWGGLIVQGFAPQYGAGDTGVCHGTGTICNVAGEGGTEVAVYGGNIVNDNSGVIKYVRIAEGGLVAGPNNEINGLTLQGVGSATTVEYVQVHGNLDDGIEWFGGTVNAKHVVLTNNDDDDIDFDEGFKGNIQFAIVVKNQNKQAPTGKNDPRGIEANSSDVEFVPDTNAVISNVTVIGGPVNNAADKEEPGMRLRGSLTVSVFNSAVAGFDKGCIRIDDSNTDGSEDGSTESNSNVTLVNVYAGCTGGFYAKRAANSETNIQDFTVTLDDAFALSTDANLVEAPAITAIDNQSGFEFEATTYVGAVAPGTSAENAWWAGWTLEGTLDDAIANY